MAKTNLPLTLTGERIEFQRLYDLPGSAGRNMTTSGSYSFTSQSSSTVYSTGSGGEYAVFLQLQTALENYNIGADDFNAKAEQSAVTAVANDLASHKADNAKHVPHLGTTTNVGNVYSVTSTETIDDGNKFSVKFNAVATNTATLNISSDGTARTLKKPDGSDFKPKAGAYSFIRDGVNFQLLGEGGEYGTALNSDVRSTKTVGTENGVVQGTLDLSNIQAGNLKEGITVDGITGTLKERVDTLNPVWKAQHSGVAAAGFTVGKDYIFVGTGTRNIRAINKTTGLTVWNFTGISGLSGWDVVYSNEESNEVFFIDHSSRSINKINENGTLAWGSKWFSGSNISNFAVVKGNVIYCFTNASGGGNIRIEAFNTANGNVVYNTLISSTAGQETVRQNPIIKGDHVYINSGAGIRRCLLSTGVQDWYSASTDNYIEYVSDTHIYTQRWFSNPLVRRQALITTGSFSDRTAGDIFNGLMGYTGTFMLARFVPSVANNGLILLAYVPMNSTFIASGLLLYDAVTNVFKTQFSHMFYRGNSVPKCIMDSNNDVYVSQTITSEYPSELIHIFKIKGGN